MWITAGRQANAYTQAAVPKRDRDKLLVRDKLRGSLSVSQERLCITQWVKDKQNSGTRIDRQIQRMIRTYVPLSHAKQRIHQDEAMHMRERLPFKERQRWDQRTPYDGMCQTWDIKLLFLLTIFMS